MLPFIEAINYLINTFYQAARHTTILRDEDICWPNNFASLNDLEPIEIFNRL